MIEAVLGTLCWLAPAFGLGWLLHKQKALWPIGVLVLFWAWLLVLPAGFAKMGLALLPWNGHWWFEAFLVAAFSEETLRWWTMEAWRRRRADPLPVGAAAGLWWTFAGAEGLLRGLGAEGWNWSGLSPLALHGLLGLLAEIGLQKGRHTAAVWWELVIWHGGHNALVLIGFPGSSWLINGLLFIRVLLEQPWKLELNLQKDGEPA